MHSPQCTDRKKAALMNAAQRAAAPEMFPTGTGEEVEEKAKWPEVHGLAAPIWKTAMNRPAQSSALAPNQASWPGAAEAAMQCLALEADKSKGGPEQSMEHEAPVVLGSQSWQRSAKPPPAQQESSLAEDALADASQLEGEEEAETRSLDVELQERDSFPVLNAHTMASRLASWDFPDCARGFRPPTQYLPQGQDVPGFACEDDSSDDSDSSSVDWDEYRGILDDCDDDDSDDDATASKEPAQASTYKKAALKGGAVKRMLPEKVLQEMWGLLAAKSHNLGIQDLLEEAGCNDETKVLQEVSSKALATLQDNSWAEQSLLEEMAAVYRAIENALSKGAQSADKSASEDCAYMLDYIRYGSCPEADKLTAALYEHKRSYFIKMIKDSMEAICEAASAALKPMLSEKFMQEAYNLTAFYSGSKVLQDCLSKVQSSSVLTGLQEASSKGAAALRGTCAEHGLEKEVACVYKALEEALRLDDDDLKLLHRYCTEGEESMKDVCANRREYLIEILAYSMQFISEAAAGALEKLGGPKSRLRSTQ